MERKKVWYWTSIVAILWLLATSGAKAEWSQVNYAGFGPSNCRSSWAMEVFNGRLFVGTGRPGRIFSTDGTIEPGTERYVWQEVVLPSSVPGIEDFEIEEIHWLRALRTEEGRWLYASASGADGTISKNVVLRSSDGIVWEPTGAVRLRYVEGVAAASAVFGGYMYVSIGDLDHRIGADVMKILRTDGSSWEELETNIELGVGDYLFEVFRVWDGYLYAGTAGPNDRPPGNDRTAEVWRTHNGTEWQKIGELHSETMSEVESMEVFQGHLYVGTKNHPPDGVERTGPELWRWREGAEWENITGLFHPESVHVDALLAYGGHLYAGVDRTGAWGLIFRSADGSLWQDVTPERLAVDPRHQVVATMREVWDALFVGTAFTGDAGTELWRYVPWIPPPGRSRMPDPSDLLPEPLYLVDCLRYPMYMGKACDPQINPGYDRFLIWEPRTGMAVTFSLSELGIKRDDGPLAAGAPVAAMHAEPAFVISVPYLDAAHRDNGAVLFFNQSGKVLVRIEGKMAGERLGLNMDVRGDEVVVVSWRRLMRIKGGSVVFEKPIGKTLRADRGVRVAFTADVDKDQQPDILLGLPYADAGGLSEAGQIHVIGSRTGDVIDTLYGRTTRQHLGNVLQPIELERAETPK